MPKDPIGPTGELRKHSRVERGRSSGFDSGWFNAALKRRSTEQPVQLLKETRTPIPATAKHAKRVDYEYERAGTATIFMFAEPLAGWREVAVRERKTAAVMLARDNMIDLEGSTRSDLRQAAVFATALGPLPHQLLKGGIHAGVLSGAS
jgi:hypothetical protein